MDLQTALNDVRAAIRQAKPLLALEAALVEVSQAEQRVKDAAKELAALQKQAARERGDLALAVGKAKTELAGINEAIAQAHNAAQEQAQAVDLRQRKQVADFDKAFEETKASKKASMEHLEKEREHRKDEVEALIIQVMKLEQLRDDLKKDMAEIASGKVAA